MGAKWGKKLTPGTRIGVYKPGGTTGDCQGQYDVPCEGNLEIRDLPPGAYEAREIGGDLSVAFEVSALAEVCVIPVKGGGPHEHEPNSDPNPDEVKRLEAEAKAREDRKLAAKAAAKAGGKK